MDINITAKKIEWETGRVLAGQQEWTESLYGFYISFDPDEEDGFKYSAAWGEGDSESFYSFEEAASWCQNEIDIFIRNHAVLTPNA